MEEKSMREIGIRHLTKEGFEKYGSYASVLEPSGEFFGESLGLNYLPAHEAQSLSHIQEDIRGAGPLAAGLHSSQTKIDAAGHRQNANPHNDDSDESFD